MFPLLFVGCVLYFLILVCSSFVYCVGVFCKQTDLDMKKGPWQTRLRSCRQVTSPEGKEARVRKPYKKLRQVTVKETQEVDSEGPTHLGHGETVDNIKRVELSEFSVETENMLDQPNAISSATMAL